MTSLRSDLTESIYLGHPLGRPIGGTPQLIEAVTREAVWEHYGQHYIPAGLIVTAAGGVDHDVVCALVTDALATGGWELTPGVAPIPRRDAAAAFSAGFREEVLISRPDLEQTQLMVGVRSYKATDERRAALGVYSAILGGGMSSRLFQEVREKRGLTYAVGSYGAPSTETGMYALYAACAPAKAVEVERLMLAEFERMMDGITDSELERAKGQIAGGYRAAARRLVFAHVAARQGGAHLRRAVEHR